MIPLNTWRDDGRWEDIRLNYGPRHDGSAHWKNLQGQHAEIETLVGMVEEASRWICVPGYNAKLENGRYIMIRWDLVERLV